MPARKHTWPRIFPDFTLSHLSPRAVAPFSSSGSCGGALVNGRRRRQVTSQPILEPSRRFGSEMRFVDAGAARKITPKRDPSGSESWLVPQTPC